MYKNISLSKKQKLQLTRIRKEKKINKKRYDKTQIVLFISKISVATYEDRYVDVILRNS